MIDKKKVLAITLARGGSVGIPRKNLALLCGKTLMRHTFDAIFDSAFIDIYYVSTEDYHIKEECRKHDVAYIDRPGDLANNNSKSSDALLHAVRKVGTEFDYVVEVMVTNPLKTHEDIDGCIRLLHDTDSDSVVSVVRLYDHHPSRVKYIEDDKMVDFYPEILESRRQDLEPAAYVRNGSIYAMKTDFIIDCKVRYNKDTRPYIMPQERTINIDEPIDLMVAQAIMDG